MTIYPHNVSSSVVLVSPAESPEHLDHLLRLEDAEEPVEEDLEVNGEGLAAVEDEAGDVERHRRLHRFHSALAHSSAAQFLKSCKTINCVSQN